MRTLSIPTVLALFSCVACSTGGDDTALRVRAASISEGAERYLLVADQVEYRLDKTRSPAGGEVVAVERDGERVGGALAIEGEIVPFTPSESCEHCDELVDRALSGELRELSAETETPRATWIPAPIVESLEDACLDAVQTAFKSCTSKYPQHLAWCADRLEQCIDDCQDGTADECDLFLI